MTSAPELRWLAGPLVSALHAARAIMKGRTIIDPRIAEALAEPIEGLACEIVAAKLPAEKFWGHLLPLAQGSGSARQLAETALTKTMGRARASEAHAARIGSQLAVLDAAFRRAYPNLGEGCLRGGPLREQWEARGQGMLHAVYRLTEDSLAVPTADILLLQPVLGGAGTAWLAYNSVGIEAVLANPVPELPEVVRLGWLLSQLNLEVPTLSERVSGNRLERVAQLAMLPVALAAGQEVELCRYDRANVAQALKVWHVSPAADENLVDTLGQWWETYADTRPGWPVALAALERMIEPGDPDGLQL